MIVQLLINFLFGILNLILKPFDLISFVLNADFMITVKHYLSVIFYIIPIANFLPIFAFIIALMGLRITIALLKTVWGILPFV
jgi:hypothetical protein